MGKEFTASLKRSRRDHVGTFIKENGDFKFVLRKVASKLTFWK